MEKIDRGARYVFLDTNSINSTSFNALFGNRDALARLAEMARIVVPETVFSELLEHKKRHFFSKKDEARKNPLYQLAGIDTEPLEQIDYDELVSTMREECEIQFDIASIQNQADAFAKIKELAIHNNAPFDKGSDKGFKDACIVLEIDDFRKQHPGAKEVLVISKDTRVADYYNDEPEVVCIESVKALLRRLPSDSAISDSDNDNLRDDKELPNQGNFQVSSGEIDLMATSLITELKTSGSFARTHNIVERFKGIDPAGVGRLAGKEILRCCIDNYQVYYVLSDRDVRNFILPFFELYQDLLNDEDYASFVDGASLPYERIDSEGHARLSRCEKEAYGEFVQALIAHIKLRGFDTVYISDSEEIKKSLSELINKFYIDEKLVNWQKVAHVFMRGDVVASVSPVNIDLLRGFMSLLQHSSKEKADAIVEALHFRLDEVEVEFPF